MTISPEGRLKAFQSENRITTKGPLSLVVQFTRYNIRRYHNISPLKRAGLEKTGELAFEL